MSRAKIFIAYIVIDLLIVGGVVSATTTVWGCVLVLPWPSPYAQ